MTEKELKRKQLFENSRAVEYARFCADENNKDKVPKYVRKQAIKWLKIVDGEIDYAYIDYKRFAVIRKLLKLMRLPDNPKLTMLQAIDDYGYWFIIATMCTLDLNGNRLYQKALLEIARKNHKTFTIAIYIIICMIFDNKYSRYFSVAPNHALSKEVQLAMQKIIGVTPILQEKFKVTRDYIRFKEKDNNYFPLAYSGDSLDGKLAATWLADEVGLLPSRYPIESMFSSQVELEDKCGLMISTKYPCVNTNVLEEEVTLIKTILDGTHEDIHYFALLYEPDEELINKWSEMNTTEQSSIIYQSNPNSVKNEKLFQTIKDKIELAILYKSRRENTLTKHLNILYRSLGAEAYIDPDVIENAMRDEQFNFYGKNIVVGIDLAEKNDNTAVTIMYFEDGVIYSKNIVFVAEDRIDEKEKAEKTEYRKYTEDGSNRVVIAGTDTCDYNVLEEWLVNFIDENDCTVKAICYDQRNASMLVARFENKYDYNCVEVPQYSSVLNAPLKEMRKMIIDETYVFEEFPMVVQNYINAKEFKDNNLNIYISKKKSTGKVDICFSNANAMSYMMEILKDGDTDYLEEGVYVD